eukprot:gene4564-5002_t
MTTTTTEKFNTEILGNYEGVLGRKRRGSTKVEADYHEISSKRQRANESIVKLDEERLTLYKDSLYKKKFHEETKLVLKVPVFSEIQYDISQRGHVKLFSFFLEVMVEQKLELCTVLHAMQLFDRVLALEPVERTDIIPIGSACLSLVCKLEEIYPIDVNGLLYRANNTFSKEELVLAERRVLRVMNYKISFPTRMDFARYYSHLLNLSPRQKELVEYLVSLSYADYNLNYFLLSEVAAAAVHYALQLTRPCTESVWSAGYSFLTRHEESDLAEPILRINVLHRHVHSYPMLGLVHFFGDEMHCAASDIYALNHSQLRFSCGKYPLKEHKGGLCNHSGITYHYPTYLHSA